jgi:hypothetical protein
MAFLEDPYDTTRIQRKRSLGAVDVGAQRFSVKLPDIRHVSR